MTNPKVTITVCVGSSCHLRGSQRVITALQNTLHSYGLENHVELKGDFCLGKCSQGVSVKIDNAIFTGITETDVESLIREQLMPLLKEG